MTKWKRKVDNKMKSYGDIDFDKKIIRVNKKKSKASGRKGEVLDTIVHEEMHKKYPEKGEKKIRKLTKRMISEMDENEKKNFYSKFYKHKKIKTEIIFGNEGDFKLT